jgi:hypothetical protein
MVCAQEYECVPNPSQLVARMYEELLVRKPKTREGEKESLLWAKDTFLCSCGLKTVQGLSEYRVRAWTEGRFSWSISRADIIFQI